MKLALIQLSDIHLREAPGELDARLSELAASVWAQVLETDVQYLLLSGDIAFSGKAGEYRKASALVQRILDEGARFHRRPNVRVVPIPGNHDCDFSGDAEIRDAVLALGARALLSKQSSSSAVNALLTPQEEFFKWREPFLDPFRVSNAPRTVWILSEEIEGESIRFICLNSAMASRLDDQQGTLFLLEPDVRALEGLGPAGLTVALMHHPANWFEANHSLVVGAALQSCADLIFTGHQHVRGAFVREQIANGGISTNFEAPVLQGVDGEGSAFRVVVVDLEAEKFRELEVQWKVSSFEPIKQESVWRDLQRNPAPRRASFVFSESFAAYLEDPGAGFSHPRRESLLLSDIYVPQDILSRTLSPSGENIFDSRRFRGEESLDFLSSTERCLVVGAERSGKTSLAKQLAKHLRNQGFISVLVNGDEVRVRATQDVARFLRKPIDNQYGEACVEKFFQLPRERRVVIVDDLHRSRMNRAGLREFVSGLETIAGRVYVFADEVYRFEELQGPTDDNVVFKEYSNVELQEMGYRLRAKLIARWHLLGQERELDERELNHQVAQSERVVNALIGKSLLPSFPISVLTILQVREAGVETGSTSYGALYEHLIASALGGIHRRGDLDIYYALLSRLARAMFTQNRAYLAMTEIEESGAQFGREVAVAIDVRALVAELEQRRILARSAGGYSFKYGYIYYFFLARWFRDEIPRNPQLRDELLKMADAVYSERNSNVLVFYLSLIRDLGVVERVLQNAERVYERIPTVRLEDDVEFLNDLFKGSLELAPGEAETADGSQGDRHRTAMDEVQAAVEVDHGDSVTYREDLEEVIKLNFAFKTLHILGQFVRNFPGSLDADLKKRVVDSCYRLGLRTLGAVLRVTGNSLSALRVYFAEVIRDRNAMLSDAEAQKAGDEAVLALARGCGFGVMKRVSNAVGLETLAQTFEAVLRENDNAATRLIDVSVKLDHFAEMPLAEIEGLRTEVRKNHYALVVLRDLVLQHLRLFPVEPRVRQRLLARFNVGGPEARYIDDQRRMIPRKDLQQ